MLFELVEPALAAGRDVVCERFHASTFAYQAWAGDLEPERVLDLLHTWAGDPRPDLTLLLDLPVEEAHARADERGDPDRIEARGLSFQERVAEGYRAFAARDERTVVVPANGDADEVARRVLEEVLRARS